MKKIRIRMTEQEKRDIKLCFMYIGKGFWCYYKCNKFRSYSLRYWKKAIKLLKRGTKKLENTKKFDPIMYKVITYKTLAVTYSKLADDLDSHGNKFYDIAREIVNIHTKKK